jgi:hypothetical protein
LFFLLLLKKSCEIIISDLKQIKRIIIFCIDYAKTVKQIFFYFWGEGGRKKKSFDIINKSAKFSCFSISDPSSHPIFGYNVKDVLSVIYKKIHGSINYIDYDTRLVTRPRSIHDFVILLGQNIDHGHVTILDFYHKLFPWAWMTPLSPHCCCIHVYCDVCSWWLYNMLESYKLHHPCNDNIRTMQKQ